MTDPRETLARIRKQANAATEGPWLVNGPDEQWAVISSGSDSVLHSYMRCRPDCEGCECGESVAEVAIELEDAEFIAAARTTVPALLDALEKVLELHQPVTDGMGFTEDGYGGISPACSSCGTSDEYAVPYPCPTVTAITTALEATK